MAAGARELAWRVVLPVAMSVLGHDMLLFLFSTFPSLHVIPVQISAFLRSLPAAALFATSSSLPYHAVSARVDERKMKAESCRAIRHEVRFRALPLATWSVCYFKAMAMENHSPFEVYPRVNICLEMNYEDREEKLQEREAADKLIAYKPNKSELMKLATDCTYLRMAYKESLIMKRTMLETFFKIICLEVHNIGTDSLVNEYGDSEFWLSLKDQSIDSARMNLALKKSSAFAAQTWSVLGFPDDVKYPQLDDSFFRKIKLGRLSLFHSGLKRLQVTDLDTVEHVRFFKQLSKLLHMEVGQLSLDSVCVRKNSSDLLPLEAFVPQED